MQQQAAGTIDLAGIVADLNNLLRLKTTGATLRLPSVVGSALSWRSRSSIARRISASASA